MAVLVNFKICDNADVCSGVAVCPTGAIYWDSSENTLKTDNSKCTSCGACEGSCPAGAIVTTHDDGEFLMFTKKIDDDPRTIEGLFVERYGASPIDQNIQVAISDVRTMIDDKNSVIIVIEIINDEDTACLISSVPVSELFGSAQVDYYKITFNDSDYVDFSEQFNIKEVPSILAFQNGEMIIKVEGAVDNNEDEEKAKLISSFKCLL